LSARTLSGWRS
jgi:hypothetical protein